MAIKKVPTPSTKEKQVPSFYGDRPPGKVESKNFSTISQKRGFGKAKKT